MGVNWRKRGEEEEVSTQRASENSSTSDSHLFLLAIMNTCFHIFTNERLERACLCDSVVSKWQFAGSLAWTERATHLQQSSGLALDQAESSVTRRHAKETRTSVCNWKYICFMHE